MRSECWKAAGININLGGSQGSMNCLDLRYKGFYKDTGFTRKTSPPGDILQNLSWWLFVVLSQVRFMITRTDLFINTELITY